MIPLLILGLVRQNPGANGYELLSLMEARHYKYIVNFTKGSFYYNLKQLEEKGFLSLMNTADYQRESNHYNITEQGSEEFQKLMYQYGSKSEYINLSFYGALLFAKEYNSKDLERLIRIQIQQTEVKIRLLKDAIEGNHEMSIHYKKMLENSMSHHIVNLEWFQSLLYDINDISL